MPIAVTVGGAVAVSAIDALVILVTSMALCAAAIGVAARVAGVPLMKVISRRTAALLVAAAAAALAIRFLMAGPGTMATAVVLAVLSVAVSLAYAQRARAAGSRGLILLFGGLAVAFVVLGVASLVVLR